MNISYRHANADDADKIAEVTIMTAGGISDFLLHDLYPNTATSELLKLAILNEKNPMSYTRTLVAECDGDVIAASNYYPASEHGIPDLMRAFIPQERLDHMQAFYNTRVENSLYIHTLGVFPDYRQTTAAMTLGQALKTMAKDKGFTCLSAHVWADNTPMLTALKLAGFEVVQPVPVARHALLPHDDGMLLMKSPELV